MKSSPPSSVRPGCHGGGFSLLEVLVAAAVFSLLLGVLVSLISQTGNVTRTATDKLTAFQSSRAAFDLMTAKLGQATLNSYWDYDNPSSPTRYVRKSELGFLVGRAGQNDMPGTAGTGCWVAFQAPAGVTSDPNLAALPGLLNEFAYYIEYGDDPGPFGGVSRSRYRLMQACRSTENLQTYQKINSGWVSGINTSAAPIAENIIFMAVWPRLSPNTDPEGDDLTKNFDYDSRDWDGSGSQPSSSNQLPPMLQLTIVAIDEKAAARLCTQSSPPGDVTGALNGLFTKSIAEDFQKDLTNLQATLNEKRISHRVFTTLVPIRESKME